MRKMMTDGAAHTTGRQAMTMLQRQMGRCSSSWWVEGEAGWKEGRGGCKRVGEDGVWTEGVGMGKMNWNVPQLVLRVGGREG